MLRRGILKAVLTPAAPLLLLVLAAGCSTTGSQSGPLYGNVPAEVREEFARAMTAINAEQYQKGEEILSGVISKSQQTPVPLINLAMVQVKLGKLDQAEKSFDAALAIDPSNPVASNELGLLYRKTGRFDEARAIYQNVLAQYPNFPAANKNLGILCDLYLRDYDCAYRAYQDYVKAVPDDETAKIWLEDVKRRVGQ